MINFLIWLALCIIQVHHGKAYCTASVYVDRPPERVWAVLIDPYKFKDKKHIKRIEVLQNTDTFQQIRYTIGIFFPVPDFVITVDSDLSPNHDHIAFARSSGSLKDIRGYWKLTRQGAGTLVEYAMYLDTGFFIPQWIVEKAQMKEVPNTLEEFKKRAESNE